MVEGGKIDWACHDNDAAAAIGDTIEFDDAVSVAFKFAEKHPNDVLIVVTGDHETGMLSVGSPGTGDHIYLEMLSNQKGSKDAFVALTEKFIKEHKEDAAFVQFKPVIEEKCGLRFNERGRWGRGGMVPGENEIKALEDAFAVSKKAILENHREGKDRFARTLIRLLNSAAGISWGSGGHSALPVNTSAWGNQAQQIAQNIRDNTDIAKQLKQTVSRLPVQNSAQTLRPANVGAFLLFGAGAVHYQRL